MLPFISVESHAPEEFSKEKVEQYLESLKSQPVGPHTIPQIEDTLRRLGAITPGGLEFDPITRTIQNKDKKDRPYA